MSKFIVSSDCCCDISHTQKNAYNIYSIPLSFIYTDEENPQELYDNMQTDDEYLEFFRKLENGSIAKTSQISQERHYDFFKKIYDIEKKDIIHITLSANLSGTNMQAQIAANKVMQETGAKIYVVDSLSATIGQGVLVKEAIKWRDKNKSFDETISHLDEIKHKIHHFFIIDAVDHVKQGGRVSKESTQGTAINIKPLIIVNKQGRLAIFRKNKGYKKSFSNILEFLEKHSTNNETSFEIVHANNIEKAKELELLIKNRFKNSNTNISVMGAVIGAHLGPGNVGVSFIGNERIDFQN